MITLYNYFRSSASYRVRIALNIKLLDYNLKDIHLVNHGGEQHFPDYRALNPQEHVPTLLENELVLTQSLAIIEYLEEKYPNPFLLPKEINDRALVRSLSQVIACDIHPINNLSVLNFLKERFNLSDEQKQQWYAHWVKKGLIAYEALLKKHNCSGLFSFGDTFTMADCCLIPQLYNANRFSVDIDDLLLLQKINNNAMQLPAVINAAP